MIRYSVIILLLGLVLTTGCSNSLPPGCPPSCLRATLNDSKLKGEDLKDADLSGAFLSQADLSEANLSGANLSGADLSRTHLVSADLSGASLVGANLLSANLTNAKLDHTDFSGANLTGAILTGVDLTRVNFKGVVLENADLVGTSLWGVNLNGIYFSGANLSGANLVGANLSGAILSKNDPLDGANLSGADLRGARLNGADLHGAFLRGANLRRAQLRQANLRKAELWGVDFTKADLSGANLEEAFLSGALLSQADLSDTNLLEAKLNGANLQGALLKKAKLNESKNRQLLEAEFLGAKYDERTTWPTWVGAPADAELVESSEPIADADIRKECGDESRLSKTLKMSLWMNSMDQKILAQFERECGVKVILKTFLINEPLISLLGTGNSGYDLMILPDYAVQLMAEKGLLAELDKSNISNIKNLDPEQMGLYYDPENKYSLPYQWGTTGIAINRSSFGDVLPDSWSVLFQPEQSCQYSNFVFMLGAQREAIGAALRYLGYSYNDTDPAHHEEAKKLLKPQKECWNNYQVDFSNGIPNISNEIGIHIWSHMAALARLGNKNVYFFIPKEGGVIWQDNMVIAADSPHKYTTEIFINYLLDPAIGARLTNYTRAFTPNKAAEKLLSESYFKLLKDGGFLVNDQIRSRLEWIEVNSDTTIFSKTWLAIQ